MNLFCKATGARGVIAALVCAVLLEACSGGDIPTGSIEGLRRGDDSLQEQALRQRAANEELSEQAGAEWEAADKQILFGDLHVHTTYSLDAFVVELPLMGLQGAHTLTDACDFARYCAKLDFYSYNDHAESLTPEHWSETKHVVRDCNARSGSGDDQDLVVFTGWEWTQAGVTADKHWGHKNIIFLGTEEDELPARPINSRGYDGGMGLFNNLSRAGGSKWLDPLHWGDYADFTWLLDQVAGMPQCPRDIPSPQLPMDCHESAPTPQILFEKLDEWGFDNFVIPHGNAWGVYTPPASSWKKQLTRDQHDPVKQSLIEIFSGHGNSEEYRDFQATVDSGNGPATCAEPAEDYTPCCWQAGEIMRSRCGDLPEAVCQQRVELARQYAADSGVGYASVFPDAGPEDWLNCGTCDDCFKPTFNHVPQSSTQYAMALSNLEQTDENGRPLRFRWGFIGSTDDHTARPGTGYKQYERRKMTMASGLKSEWVGKIAERKQRMEDPQMPQQVPTDYPRPDGIRLQSFLFPGGIVATHSAGRSREQIWSALKRKETYATSGPRMLLWFDLLNGPDGREPMGSEVRMPENPRFEVRAAGAFRQKPGCPADAVGALSEQRLEYLCAGECYHPGDERLPITTIEVIRIRPQVSAQESPGELIEDVWQRFECTPDQDGCVVQFEDKEFLSSGRDVLYYVRALQEETPAINGNLLRPEFDDNGKVVKVNPCHGDYKTDLDDNCLAPVQERAWSSPIYVDQLLSATGG